MRARGRARLGATAAMPPMTTALLTAALMTAALMTAALMTVVLPAAQAGAAVRGPVKGLDVLNTLACPTSTSCVSTGSNTNGDGKGAVITAATGAVKVWSGDLTQDPNAVACPPSAKKCLFVADDAVGTMSMSTGALKVTATPPPPPDGIVALGALACPKSCYAVGFEETETASNAVLLHLSASGKILATTTDTGADSSAIACPTATLCLMSDYAKPTESIQVVKGGHIGASQAFPADTFVRYISCYASSACYALGGNNTASPELTNEIFPLNPKTGAIGSAASISGDFSGISMNCLSATTCLVAGFIDSGSGTAALVTVTSGAPGSPVDYTGENLDAAACATSSECYGVGLASSGAIVDQVTG
jgi:hypothetical protein